MIYLLIGEEQYIIDQELRKIINENSSQENMDFSVTFYDCEDTPVQVAIEDAQTLSLMLEPKTIILKNAIFLTGQQQKTTLHDSESLETYIDNPNEETNLILIAPYESIDGRKRIVKKLKKVSTVIEAKKMKEYETKKWINVKCSQLEVSITTEAVEYLYMMVGANLHMLSQELEKLAIYVGSNGKIETSTIHLLIKKTLDQNIFAFIEKVAKKDFIEAHNIFNELITMKEDPIKIAGTLSKQFSRMLEAKVYIKEGSDPKEIAKLLKIHPYASSMIVKQSRGFHEVTLQKVLKLMSELDYDLKRGNDKRLSFEMFLVSLKYA